MTSIYQWIKDFFHSTKAPQPLYRQCYELYLGINIPDIIDPLNQIQIQFQSFYKNIELYTANLAQFHSTIVHSDSIARENLPYDLIQTTLHEFLYTIDESYQDEAGALFSFRGAVLSLCMGLGLPLAQITHTHNRRMCQKLLENLIEIGESLESNL